MNKHKKLIINLIGPTGAGKGTQGGLLSEHYKIPHISTGDLFRSEIALTALGKLIKHHLLKNNSLVPDEITYGILVNRFSKGGCENGFILDGFPVTQSQVKALSSVILSCNDLYVPIVLSVSNNLSSHRLRGRNLCTSCYYQLLNSEKICPKCGNITISKREDDQSQQKIHDKRLLYNMNFKIIHNELSLIAPILEIEQDEKMSKEKVFIKIISHIEALF